jgi:archaellum component FlaC
MNSGIIDLIEYQKIENDIKQYYIELTGVTKSINGEFEQIISSTSNSDLNFLCMSYKKQIDELEKINTKIENYYSIISNVRNGYQNQVQETTQNINLYLNKLKEEL